MLRKRNKFPKGTKVKLLMCDNPECKCQSRYTVGEDATVSSVSKKHIIVECEKKYGGLMTRTILFSRLNSEAHMELLKKPMREKKVEEQPAEACT